MPPAFSCPPRSAFQTLELASFSSFVFQQRRLKWTRLVHFTPAKKKSCAYANRCYLHPGCHLAACRAPNIKKAVNNFLANLGSIWQNH